MKLFLFILFLALTLQNNPNLSQHSLEIYGNASLGYYYVKIYVGHPPQQQTVIIDTGSGQLAIPCNKCQRCNKNHINRPFDMSKSKTAQYITCQSLDPQCSRCTNRVPTDSCTFSISYAEGSSLEGIIIRDSIQFQSFSEGQQITTSFGCTTSETNLFLKALANGIFGLAPYRTSNLLEEMYKKHHQFSGQQLQFSLCLARNGGYMSFGGINHQIVKNNSPIKISYSSHKNLYSLIDVKQITIGQTAIHETSQKFGYYGIFVDSGSTFTYFPRKNYELFRDHLLKSCKKKPEKCENAEGQSTLCFHLKGQEEIFTLIRKVFEPIILKVSNSTFKWEATKYFLLRDIRNRQVCLGVQPLDRYLLGANWMVDRNIVFNLKDKEILVYSDVQCVKKQSSTRLMSQYTNKIEGHKPLNYQSFNILKGNISRPFQIILGIVLTFLGSIGLIVIFVKKNDDIKLEEHKPVSSNQTQVNQETNL